MNPQLQSFARATLLDGLNQLPSEWQNTFKLMYARGGFTAGTATRSVEEAQGVPIEQVVAEIPEGELDWAMTQVQNSLNKLAKQ